MIKSAVVAAICITIRKSVNVIKLKNVFVMVGISHINKLQVYGVFIIRLDQQSKIIETDMEYVTCPAVAHAIKKLLAPGLRGVKTAHQDGW